MEGPKHTEIDIYNAVLIVLYHQSLPRPQKRNFKNWILYIFFRVTCATKSNTFTISLLEGCNAIPEQLMWDMREMNTNYFSFKKTYL